MGMTDNKRSRRILVVLVAAHYVLHAVALSVIPYRPIIVMSDVVPPPLLAFTLPSTDFWIAKASLAIWVGLGSGRLLWRLLPAVLALVIYTWAVPGAYPALTYWTLVQICGLFLIRSTGLEFERSTALKKELPRFQFYIRDMLAWMTSLALILSAFKSLPSDAMIGMSLRGN